ncbi:DEAD/DEAH box helicase [Lignipirellula cremea]|nr:DEAD/DEAH box helicase [Lignipirellula cremea]
MALRREPKLTIESLPLATDKPRCVSLALGKTKLKTHSFTFPESPGWNFGKKKESEGAATKKKPTPPPGPEDLNDPAAKPKKITRIRPPGDVIKLQDRLYYLLQPPMENLAASGELEFPFEPFPYQFEGVAFLYPRFAAVLADEMGLGKTMQAITTIRFLLCSAEVRNVLLVCPKPLVTNWQREFALWAPEIPLTIIEGDQAKRTWQWQQKNSPVKIANYELLMRDRDIVLDPDNHYDLVVLDEAQRIKNRSGTTSQIVRAISRTRSWALTGTPVENSPEDLVGIFEFLAPGFLNDSMDPRRMGKSAGEYILRRTKDLVLTDMPPKLYREAEIALSPEQYCSYRSAEDDGVMQLNDLGDSITITHVFELVLRLKQICNFDPLTGASSKLERLQADLEEVAASGQKAIVFSQWVKTIEHIDGALQPYNPLQYHGKIPSKKRDPILKEFKENPKRHVLLMSYGAGSVGLNLQFCRYVFLFDRWWNPAIEDQAINRAHRIGAAGSVTVTRMISVDTIEERINQVLEEKRQLFDAIFSETGLPKSASLSQDDIFGLFQLRTPKGLMKKKAA